MNFTSSVFPTGSNNPNIRHKGNKKTREGGRNMEGKKYKPKEVLPVGHIQGAYDRGMTERKTKGRKE